MFSVSAELLGDLHYVLVDLMTEVIDAVARDILTKHIDLAGLRSIIGATNVPITQPPIPKTGASCGLKTNLLRQTDYGFVELQTDLWLCQTSAINNRSKQGESTKESFAFVPAYKQARPPIPRAGAVLRACRWCRRHRRPNSSCVRIFESRNVRELSLSACS